jgi:hypothetical protein
MEILKSASYLTLRKRLSEARPTAGLFFSGWQDGFQVTDKLISDTVYLGEMQEAANALIIATDGVKPTIRLAMADNVIFCVPISKEIAGWLNGIRNGEATAIENAPEKYNPEAHLGLFLLLGLYLKKAGLVISIKQDSVHKNKNKSLPDSPNFKIFGGWLPTGCKNYDSSVIKFCDLWDKTTKRILSFKQICAKYPIYSDELADPNYDGALG